MRMNHMIVQGLTGSVDTTGGVDSGHPSDGRTRRVAMYKVEFDDYKDKYENIKFERDDAGVLTVTLHTDGGELNWGVTVHHQIGYMWADIGADPENKVIIFTGSGSDFIAREDLTGTDVKPKEWVSFHMEAKRLQMALLEIEQPMIAAINGPCTLHAELPLMCDIVLASENATIADHPHYPWGTVPGDGIQVILPLLLGLNRARYMQITGQTLSARESQDLGLVNEVVGSDQLLPRARELASLILEAPELTVRLTRPAFMQHVKRLMLDNLSLGFMYEGMAAIDHWPPSHGTTQVLPS
jgi:enoyl-CoA hydratase/carnithine racemase